MMTDEEFYAHINKCIEAYKGDTTLMNEAVGLLVVGRVMGWEHQRITSTRASWTFATKHFIDPKLVMEKRTAIGQRKSNALHMVDKLLAAGQIVRGYLDFVQRKVSVPMMDLRTLEN